MLEMRCEIMNFVRKLEKIVICWINNNKADKERMIQRSIYRLFVVFSLVLTSSRTFSNWDNIFFSTLFRIFNSDKSGCEKISLREKFLLFRNRYWLLAVSPSHNNKIRFLTIHKVIAHFSWLPKKWIMLLILDMLAHSTFTWAKPWVEKKLCIFS